MVRRIALVHTGTCGGRAKCCCCCYRWLAGTILCFFSRIPLVTKLCLLTIRQRLFLSNRLLLRFSATAYQTKGLNPKSRASFRYEILL